ncbi:MAG: recombinase family protein [Candidatus Cybelea sp.]
MKKAVSYLRVSMTRQGQSGLGLEAQCTSVEAFCKANGYKLVEVESGRKIDRSILRDPLARREHSYG